jgi:hypothetical protein
MRCIAVAVLLMVCSLQLAGSEVLARGKQPEEPDTAKVSDIYNPPRVITPAYESGPRPAGETLPGAETGVPGTSEPSTDRTTGQPCATCGGGSRARVGGGGGFSLGYLAASLEDINPRIREMGIPALSDEVLMIGGRGYARVGHLVIGGAGYGGDTETGGIPDCCARYARVGIAYGGVIFGLTMAQPRYEATAGMLLGGGSIEIVRERTSRSVGGWDDAWEIFDKTGSDSVATEDLNVTSKITGEFMALEPFLEVKYRVLPLMAFGLSASYLSAKVGHGEWKVDGVSIPDSPESNIGGWSLRFGLHFGI